MDQVAILYESVRIFARRHLNRLSRKKSVRRDEGFVRAYSGSKPDAIVVGDIHAMYMKLKHPELDYTLFIPERANERAIRRFRSYSKLSNGFCKPDKTVYQPTSKTVIPNLRL